MTIRTRMTKIHRDVPIEVDAEINNPEQIEVVREIFKEIAKMVDEYHRIKELRFQRKLRRLRWCLVTGPEQAMSYASNFLFNEKVS